MKDIKRCKVPKKLLGPNIREVSKPDESFQRWKTTVDESTLSIDNYEIDFPDMMDPDEDQWITAVEKPGQFRFLTEYTTLDKACDAVKRHLKKYKKSLY